MRSSDLFGQSPDPAHGLSNGNGNGNGSSPDRRSLHRLAEVRKQQGMSLRTLSRHLHTNVRQLKAQEIPTADLPLSTLYRWQEALGVPIMDLLVESQAPLSPAVRDRAQLVKVMKTAAAIGEKAESLAMRRLAQRLVEQLLEIMPELEGVSAWPSVGQRRSLEETGRIVERRLCGSAWRDLA